ncbi:hypothetical protein ACRDNQ_03180 [Palleronia sp. KMU-117]|uniref:hypothetical protein n=1 Tax=Palleronia sp. KMU-117 TaxID=3434108 RepID=UPI003D75F91F
MFPNPADAFTNPVRYWSDLAVLQIELSRQIYEAACLMNPYLPRVGVGVGWRGPAAGTAAARSMPARALSS